MPRVLRGRSVVQSIIFDKNNWDVPAIMNWLMAHNFKPIKPLQDEVNYYHARLYNPDEFMRIRSKRLDNHTILRIGFY